MLDKVKEMKEHITLRQTTMTFSKETVKVVKMSKLSTKKYEYVDRGVLYTRTNSSIISQCFEIKYLSIVFLYARIIFAMKCSAIHLS